MVGTVLARKEKEVHEEENGNELLLKEDPATERLRSKFNHHPIHLLSLSQIGLGIISLLCQIIISYCNDVHLDLTTINEGAFSGMIFAISGSVGLFTFYKTNHFNVKAFLIMNIFAALFSIVLLLLSSCLLGDTLWYEEEDG